MIDIENYTDYYIAQSYTTAIEYGDMSGLDDENEIASVERFIDEIGTRTVEWLNLDEPEFTYCEISNLRADCVIARVYEEV